MKKPLWCPPSGGHVSVRLKPDAMGGAIFAGLQTCPRRGWRDWSPARRAREIGVIERRTHAPVDRRAHHRAHPVAAGARRLHQLPDLFLSRHHRGRVDHARRCRGRGADRRARAPDDRLGGGVRRGRDRGNGDGHPAHAFQDQRAARRHPRDDRALFREPARDGEKQPAAPVGADAGVDGRVGGALRAREERRASARMGGWHARRGGARRRARNCRDRRRVPVSLLQDQSWDRHAGCRRQPADDPRPRRQRGQHDRPRPSLCRMA